MDRYDIIAIGGGAAGLVTAAGAAGLGARVALIERGRMGGECLWTGCIPSKALLASARIVATARAGARYGIDLSEPRVDFARVMQHVHSAQQTIAPHDSPERFRSLGVDVVQETATFLDRERVQAGDRLLAARHVVIATGTRPAIPNIPGIGAVPLLTNENVFELTELPASLIVLGGGAVGVELAQAFALLGSQVTLLESESQLLRTEDGEIVELLRARLQQDGVKIHTGCKIDAIAPDAGGVRVQSSSTRFTAARLLVAAGRTANTDTLDLGAAGIAHDANALHVDRYLRTNIKNIWGVGDVTGAPRFTHVADYQARLVIRNALFPGRTAADYSTVPWAIYTSPELAHVGLTEKQARDQHGDNVQVWRKPFAELDRAVADGETNGMVKVVADKHGRILGAHILGGQASTLLGEVALAMKQKVRLSALSSIVHAYPTYPEAIKQVADAYVRSRFTGLARRAAGWIVRR
ncbi:MAG TPA: FAD-dependent oxidoreductase [Longimicrobiales bacterium]